MNKIQLLSIVSLLAVFTFGTQLRAQSPVRTGERLADTLSLRWVHQLGFDLRPGYVTPTNEFFKGNNAEQKKIRNSLSAHLKYAFRFGKDSRQGRLYPHAYQGIGVAYNTFFSPGELGNPVSLYVFQGSRITTLSPRLSLDYEWNFGASFGWKKYHETYNSFNRVIGSPINAYINLAFLFNWQLHPQWSLVAGVDFTHYSNGNTHYPNAGVNPIGGRVGLVHTLGNRDEASLASKRTRRPSFTLPSAISYDVVVYGATRKRGFIKGDQPCLVPGSFGVVGLNFNPMYGFSNYFKAGLSVDAQYDESANIRDYRVGEDYSDDVKFHRPPFRKQFAVGLSLRGEWVMPIFSVNVGVGRNLIYSGDDTKGFYQTLALKTFVTRQLFLHVGYQLSKFKNPNNLMLGVGYRFNAH